MGKRTFSFKDTYFLHLASTLVKLNTPVREYWSNQSKVVKLETVAKTQTQVVSTRWNSLQLIFKFPLANTNGFRSRIISHLCTLIFIRQLFVKNLMPLNIFTNLILSYLFVFRISDCQRRKLTAFSKIYLEQVEHFARKYRKKCKRSHCILLQFIHNTKFSLSNEISICDDKIFVIQHVAIQPDAINGLFHVYMAK